MTGPVPLSFAQQRLWFLDQLEPSSPFYNIPMALHLTGPLDLAALHRALDTIVARHEVLRTTFTAQDGKPLQIIGPARSMDLPVVRVPQSRGAAGEEAMLRIATDEAAQPFDLARGPLLRASLFELGPEEHLFVLVLHHIVSDGWSTALLFRELGECYRAFHAGASPRLSDLPIQYADYAVWQQEWLQGERLDEQLRYWRTQLAGVPPVLELPTDHPRPTIQTYRGARIRRPLSEIVARAVTALARQEQATPFMVLMAAFHVLLSRYTGRRDIVVGTPIAGRTHLKLEGLIGLFVNTLALRTDLSGDPTFRELLGRMRGVAIGAYAHQELPFERLVEALQPERSRQHAPLVQVMLAYQNTPPARLTLTGLEVRPLRVTGRTAKFDLSLALRPGDSSLDAELEYATDLFDGPTVERMLDNYEILLQGIVADPSRRVSALPLLTATERRRVVVEWNPAGAPDHPGPRCIHQLIEAQAAHTPEKVAVVVGDERLTYRELDRRANRLAHRLRALGVVPEVRVGLAVERSADLVVGVLGILKAGGVYLPLDPGYPEERLRFMVADAKAPVVVTGDVIRESAAESPESPGVELSPDNMAYVIYTSGSSGTPKGVAVTHGALSRHSESVTQRYGLRADDRILQFSASSWDASLEQMLPTLTIGATMVLRGPEVWTPQEFRRQMLGNSVTAANLPTAYADELIREWTAAAETAPAGGGFRLLVVGGEALRAETVRLWRQTPLHGLRLLNAYGPTETTITATVLDVPDAPPAGGTVPIGRPLSGRTAYVLDRYQNPVPIGVAGELYLGGASLARGYLDRPALTAERFVPDPFGATPGARLYRTGDLVRFLPEGDIEFLGRLDQQIKLRGYRIEPGEIEAALALHPAVRDVVVLLREDSPRDRRLVAYLVSAQPASAQPTAAALREHLSTRVPGYMVPSAFVWLAALPLTSQGKVDRRALPAPDPAGSDADRAAKVPPRSRAEARLAEIWSEVLGVETVYADDDFFDLGGHSLLATQVVSRIARAFEVELPLSVLFEAPTLARLAERVETARQRGAPSALVPLQRKGSRPPLIVIHGAWGDLFAYRELAARLGPDQPIYGFESPMEPDGAASLRTIEALAADYIRELRAFQPEGPYFLCGYCWAGGLTFEMGCQLRSAGQEVALLALIDSSAPGYRLPAPLRRKSKPRFRDLGERAWRNLRRLGTLRPGAVPAFLGDRIGNLVTELAGGPAFRLSLRLGRALLPHLRTRHGALSYAGRLYRPSRYPGRVTLFRAQPPSGVNGELQWGWDRVSAGGVELCLLEAEHDTIMEYPQVEALAVSLGAALERAAQPG